MRNTQGRERERSTGSVVRHAWWRYSQAFWPYGASSWACARGMDAKGESANQ